MSKRAGKSTTTRRGFRRRLRKAQRRRDLVALPRRYDGLTPPVEGFVVGSSKTWVLLAGVTDGLEPDGWTAVRVKDLRGLRVRPGAAGLTGRALKARGQWPPVAPRRVDLSDVAALVRSVDARTPLFAVHIERDRPDALWLGVGDRLSRSRLRLRTVDPHAKWAGHQDFALKDVTRIDFGNTYAEAVLLVAGDAPGRRLRA